MTRQLQATPDQALAVIGGFLGGTVVAVVALVGWSLSGNRRKVRAYLRAVRAAKRARHDH